MFYAFISSYSRHGSNLALHFILRSVNPTKMAPPGDRRRFFALAIFLAFLVFVADGTDLFYDWHAAIDTNASPVSADQPVDIAT